LEEVKKVLLSDVQLYKDPLSPEQLTSLTFKRSYKICTSWSHFQRK